MKCIALLSSRTSLISDGFQRHPQTLSSLRPKGRFTGTKDSAGVLAPSTGLRPLIVSRVKWGGPCDHSVLPCTGNTICLQCAFIKGARFDIRPRKHVVAATWVPPFKVGDNQRPERTGAGVRKPSPESFVPGDNLDRGINCGGDMGVRRCLARSLTSLAPMRTPKSANGPRSNSLRPDSPSMTNLQPGTEDSARAPSPHRTRSAPDASSTPQLNLHNVN